MSLRERLLFGVRRRVPIPKLSTTTKLGILKGVRASVLAGRRLLGQSGTRVEVERNGLRWSLDLNEGIDFSIFLIGRFELTTSRVIASLLSPGMVALDIGANVGAHALPMARAVGPTGRVYAIEPTRWAFDHLLENRALNPGLAESLVPVHALLTTPEVKAPAAFYSSWGLEGARGDEHPVHQGSPKEIGDARALSMDALVEEQGLTRLDLIKLDVDGWECAVLESGQKTLARFHPPIVLELAPHVLEEQGVSLDRLLGILRGHGYELVFELNRKPLPIDPAAVRALIPAKGSINVLARRP